jgi:hypothetical protein
MVGSPADGDQLVERRRENVIDERVGVRGENSRSLHASLRSEFVTFFFRCSLWPESSQEHLVSLQAKDNIGRGFAPSCSTHVVPRRRRRKHGAPVQGDRMVQNPRLQPRDGHRRSLDNSDSRLRRRRDSNSARFWSCMGNFQPSPFDKLRAGLCGTSEARHLSMLQQRNAAAHQHRG